jgi:energy-coupling factor transport system permease protein
MDARAKLILMIAYIVAVFFASGYTAYAVVALFLIIMVGASRVPLRLVLRSVRMVLYLVVFTAVLNVLFHSGDTGETPLFAWWIMRVYKSGLIYASQMSLRLLLLVIGPTLLTLTTTPVQLTDAIESLLRPLRLIRFPVHELAMIMSIALSIVPVLMDETDKIIKAQKARGADFDSGNLFKRARALVPVLIPLFVSSFRRADDLALAMDSRCYRGSKGRTKMKIPHFTYRDVLGTLFLGILLAAVLFMKYNWFAWGFISVLY